jgi:hypothetical protein
MDLLDAVAATRDFERVSPRVHPPVEPAMRATAASFWLIHRVAGLVVRLYSPDTLDTALGEQGARAVRDAAASYQRRSLSLQHALRTILLQASDADIWMMPFKGVVDAAELYCDPGARFCGDLDLLVRPEQLDEAGRLLASLHYRQVGVFATLGPRGKRWWLAAKHAVEWHNPSTGVSVDLHWRLNELPMVKLDDRGWFEAAREASCWGVPCKRLPPFERYLALSTHAVRSNWSLLRAWVDVLRAREIAARVPRAEGELQLLLQRVGAASIDAQWSAARFELSRAANGAPPRGPARWLLEQRGPSDLEQLRALRLQRGFAYRVAWLKATAVRWGDVGELPLPDALFPLYFVLRPVLKVGRVLTSLRAGRARPQRRADSP